MANFYYTPQLLTGMAAAGFDLVRFLCDNHASLTGPGWTVIDADDGTNRDQPAGPNFDLTELGGSNLWNPANGSPPTGSWIVIESLDSNNTNHCQVWIHLQSSTEVQFRVIPFEDFAAGGGTTGGSDPTFPATSFGNSSASNQSFSFQSGVARFLGVATEGNMVWLGTVLSDEEWIYFGEVDGAADASTGASPPDDRAYTILRTTADVHIGQSINDEPFCRLSPLDDTTVIGDGNTESGFVQFYSQAEAPLTGSATWPRMATLSEDHLLPIGAAFFDTGHQHFMGYLRNVRGCNGQLGSMGTFDGHEWLYYNDRRSSASYTCVVFKWDGATRFP